MDELGKREEAIRTSVETQAPLTGPLKARPIQSMFHPPPTSLLGLRGRRQRRLRGKQGLLRLGQAVVAQGHHLVHGAEVQPGLVGLDVVLSIFGGGGAGLVG